VVSKGLWTSLSDLIGASSFDHAKKSRLREKFFSNKDSATAQELEREIGRVTRLWLDTLQPLGRDPDKEADTFSYSRLGVGKISFGVGFKSFRRPALATLSASASVSSLGALKRSRSMAHAAWPSLGATATGACSNSVSDVLTPWCPCSRRSTKSRCSALSACRLRFLAGKVGDEIRNHVNSAQCSVDKYGHNLQAVVGAKDGATRNLYGAFLAVLAHSLR
jgi:hypothetical protein